MTAQSHFVGSPVVSLTGIPLDDSPPRRIREEPNPELHRRLEEQVADLQCEVGNLHTFAQVMDEHGDEVLQSVAMQMAVFMRHFDTRLNEIASIVSTLGHRQRQVKP